MGPSYNGLLPLAIKYYGYMAESGPYIFTKVLPFDTLNGLGALFVTLRAFPVWRRFGLPYAVFILINILPPLAPERFLLNRARLGGALSGLSLARRPSCRLGIAQPGPVPLWLCRRSTPRFFIRGTQCSEAPARWHSLVT